MTEELNVLVVDNDELNLEILVKNIEDLNHKAIEFLDSEHALQYMMENPDSVDFTVLDIMMPGMDGVELSRQMHMNQNLCDIPIVLQSGKVSDHLYYDAMEVGSYYYLQKPFKVEQMDDMVSLVCHDLDRRHLLKKMLDKGEFVDSVSIALYSLEDIEKAAVSFAKNSTNPIETAVALFEIMINAIEYGVLCMDGNKKTNLIKTNSWHDEVTKGLAALSDNQKNVQANIEYIGNKAVVTIHDIGSGFDWQQGLRFDPKTISKLHGRGIYRASQVLELEFLGSGNEVRCTFDMVQ